MSMCEECGGEWGHTSGCTAGRYEAARWAEKNRHQDEIDAITRQMQRLTGQFNIAWAALSIIGDPGPETIKLDPRGVAREALEKLRTPQGKTDE